MGYYNPNPPDADPAQPSAAQAAAIAGAAVGFRGSYGGQSGQAAADYATIQRQQEAQRALQQQQQLQQRSIQQTQQQQEDQARITSYAQAQMDANRPGFPAGYVGGELMPDGSIRGGHPAESQMQADRIAAGMPEHLDQYALMNVEGRPGYTRGVGLYSQTGIDIENKRMAAYKTPTKADDRLYDNKIQQWEQNQVELSASYHYLGNMLGVPVKANPYENVGDIALATLKGGNQKENLARNYAFNPNVGNVLQVLPQKRTADGSLSPVGMQEYSWMGALALDRGQPDVGAVSFMPAIEYINSQRERQGVYGDLFGGMKDTFTPLPKGFANGGILGESSTNGRTVIPTTQVAGMGVEMGGYKKPFLSTYAGTPQQTQPRSMFDDYAQAISKTMRSTNPVGAAIVSIFGGNAIKGLYTAELRNQYESTVSKQTPILDSLIPSYEAGVAGYSANRTEYEKRQAGYIGNATNYQAGMDAFNSTVSLFNTRVGNFNKNPTNQTEYNLLLGEESKIKTQQAGLESTRPLAEYTSLMESYARLNTEKNTLDAKKSIIDAAYAPVQTAKTRYETAAAGMVNNVDQKSLLTYGAGSWLQGLGTGYQNTIAAPVGTALKPLGAVGQFITGVVETPGQIAGLGGQSMVGGETILRGNIPNLPGLTAGGLSMMGKGMYDMGTTNPAGLAGNIAGFVLLTGAVRYVGKQGVGMIRTRGMDYVPIENIGYDSKMGYPINPTPDNAPALARSFSRGTLEPAPTEMSLSRGFLRTTEPPYVPGVSGHPFARLPNAAPGDITLWTGFDSNAMTRGINVGEATRIAGAGSSELDAIYGAPSAQGYFTKVGLLPKSVGLDMPFKTPTIYSTTVSGLESTPEALRVAARSKNYVPMNDYMQARSPQIGGTAAYLPLFKSEYEAVIPQNSIIEVTGRNYFTKIGGFGKSHFAGTRVPIVEQNLIGFDAVGIVPVTPRTVSGSSYIGSPKLSIFNLYAGISAASGVSGRRSYSSGTDTMTEGFSSGGNSKTYPTPIGAYSLRGISGLSPGVLPVRPLSKVSSSKSSKIFATESTAGYTSTGLSSMLPSLSTGIYSVSSRYKTTTSPALTSIQSPEPIRSLSPSKSRTTKSPDYITSLLSSPMLTSLYSPGYSPATSPITSPYTPARTPPYSSITSSPITPFVTPPITPYLFPTLPFGGFMSGGGDGIVKRLGKKPFREKIPLRSMLFGKAPKQKASASLTRELFRVPKAPATTFYRAAGKGKIIAVESVAAPRRVATRRRKSKKPIWSW